MKTRLALLGVLAAAVTATAHGGTGDLKEFTSKDGGYTIQLPAAPVEKKVGAQTQALIDQGNKAYLVAFQEVPGMAKAGPDLVKKSLENGRDAAVASFKGKLLASKEIKLGDYPGLEFQIEVPGLGVYRSRIYQVRDRLYQVTIMGPKELATGKMADQIFDSFKLVK